MGTGWGPAVAWAQAGRGLPRDEEFEGDLAMDAQLFKYSESHALCPGGGSVV